MNGPQTCELELSLNLAILAFLEEQTMLSLRPSLCLLFLMIICSCQTRTPTGCNAKRMNASHRTIARALAATLWSPPACTVSRSFPPSLLYHRASSIHHHPSPHLFLPTPRQTSTWGLLLKDGSLNNEFFIQVSFIGHEEQSLSCVVQANEVPLLHWGGKIKHNHFTSMP